MAALNPTEAIKEASDVVDTLAGKKTPAQFIQVVHLIAMVSQVALVGALLYGGYVVITDKVPEHLEKINTGFKEVAKQSADSYKELRAAEIIADKERYDDHKKTDAERYEWIKELGMKLRPMVGATQPNDEDQPFAGTN